MTLSQAAPTDACQETVVKAVPSARAPRKTSRRRSLKVSSVSDLRRLFCRNQRPIYSISATDFNLAGHGPVGRQLQAHLLSSTATRAAIPACSCRGRGRTSEFCGIEDVNNHLLRHEDVISYIRARGGDPVAVFLMFDETTERICHDLGMEIWFPPAGLRQRCDNKVETVRIGNRAGVPSVPNTLGKVRSYAQLLAHGSAGRVWATTWWSRRPTVIPATPPTSSRTANNGAGTPPRSRPSPR